MCRSKDVIVWEDKERTSGDPVGKVHLASNALCSKQLEQLLGKVGKVHLASNALCSKQLEQLLGKVGNGKVGKVHLASNASDSDPSNLSSSLLLQNAVYSCQYAVSSCQYAVNN